jgi:thiamine kinase-like enzyme
VNSPGSGDLGLRLDEEAWMSVIEEVVAKIDDWRGRNIAIEPLSGGLTNANFRVVVDGTSYFVRVPGANTELLAVDRANEYFNASAADRAGVGPQILYYLPEFQVMVLEFLQGATMSNASLGAAGMPTRVAQVIRRLHSCERFLTDFNMFRLTEFYLNICKEHEVRIPDGYYERLPKVERIEQALLAHPLASVPCHNDLLAENYMLVGDALRLIDYEYSGNNDPCFELGNTCQELKYDESCIGEVCAAYFGDAYPDKIARMKLNMIMSDVGWGLWAAIQAKISKIEYDFWGWATERWGRAVEKLDSGEFDAWLADVQA